MLASNKVCLVMSLTLKWHRIYKVDKSSQRLQLPISYSSRKLYVPMQYWLGKCMTSAIDDSLLCLKLYSSGKASWRVQSPHHLGTQTIRDKSFLISWARKENRVKKFKRNIPSLPIMPKLNTITCSNFKSHMERESIPDVLIRGDLSSMCRGFFFDCCVLWEENKTLRI